jgi:benzoyl-CoA reductase/2-hydroxyglutaryl-CoA dehydratase subunit BcrC/BadD/HgdB
MEAEVRPLKMTEKLMGLVGKYWQDLWEGQRGGKLVAWCSGMSPHELLRAMDISVVYLEGYGGICSVAGVSTDLCQRAEAIGYSPDLCSLIRNFIGATRGIPAPDPEMLPFGGLPKPDLMVCQPYCPGVYKTWEKYSRFFNVPLLVIERPYLHDALNKAEIAQFVREGTEELQEMVTFLESFTRRRLDYDRLGQSLALEREASNLWWDAVEMCRNIPAPMSIFDVFSHVFPFTMYRGEPEAVTYYQELKSELVERITCKVGPMAAEEKYRLYWDNLPIYYRIAEHIQKFASYGAVPVAAMFPFYFGSRDLDPKRPLESIVELFLFNPNNRGLKGRIDLVTKLIEDYSIDGLVMQRSRTCLLTNMGQDDIMKAVIAKTGLPAVVIEGDMCDSRFYSDSEVNNKIDAFMEILAQKGPRRR